MDYCFEPLTDAHRFAVIAIYNRFVREGLAAYPDQPVPPAFFDRLLEMARDYPAAAVVSAADETIGFGFLHAHHFAATLRRTAEISYFLLPEHTRRGVGTALLEHLLAQAPAAGIDNVLASISSLNEASIAFHLKNGFRECGRFRRVGRKFGRDFDVVWMQRELGAR